MGVMGISGISERSPPDHRTTDRTTATRSPFTGVQPVCLASLRPLWYQSPESSPESSPQRGGGFVGFRDIRHKYGHIEDDQHPRIEVYFPPVSRPTLPYMQTYPSAAFSRNFLFLFFYFGTRRPILDSCPFLRP